MSNFLRIAAGLVILIIALLIAALFVKKEVVIKQQIIINCPKQDVYDYIKFLKHEDTYNKWVMADRALKKDFTGTDGTLGYLFVWESKDKNIGEGEQEITKLTEGREVECEIRFISPRKNKAVSLMTTDSVSPGVTRVEWVFSSRMKYPGNLMRSKYIKRIGKDLATSLKSLKERLERSYPQ